MSKTTPTTTFDNPFALMHDERAEPYEALREGLIAEADVEIERLPADQRETQLLAAAGGHITLVGTPLLGLAPSTVEESFGWVAFKFVASHVGSAVAGKIGGKVADIGFGVVLKLFGYQNADDPVVSKLKELETKLDKISELIAGLSRQMSDLLAAVNMEADKIISEVNALEIKRSVDAITFAYDRLAREFRAGASGAHTAAGSQAASAFAREIRHGNRAIAPQLWNMHTSIMGTSPGTTGVLDAMANLLIDRVNAGHDLYGAYQALEAYFGQFLAIEAKGLTLIVEALNQAAPLEAEAAAPLGPALAGQAFVSGGYAGTAKDYWEKEFTPMVEQQVDKFLTCVDRLVLSQANIRTDLARPVPLFPHLEKVERIYAKADFMAAQVAPSRHQPGIIARLVGEPGNIEAALRVQAVSYADATLAPVPVNGNTINYYEPAWPAHFPVKKYLEWQWVGDETFNLYRASHFLPDGHRRFVAAERLAVLKLRCPAPADDAGRGATVHVTHEHGQEVDLAYRDDHFTATAAPDVDDVLYGHVLFPIRHAPAFLDLGVTVMDNQGGWTVQVQRDVNKMTQAVNAVVAPQKCDQHLAVSAKGGFGVPIVSGSDQPVTIGAIWSCAGSVIDATRASMVWWLNGCVTAETCVYVVAPGAENPPDPTGLWHVPDSQTWQSHVDNLGFAPGQMQVLDVTTALHTGTFIYRYTPTQSKFRLKCRLPHAASASVAVELKSLEVVLR